jgi:signal transduction histidine kinase
MQARPGCQIDFRSGSQAKSAATRDGLAKHPSARISTRDLARMGALNAVALSQRFAKFLIWRCGLSFLFVCVALSATLLIQRFFPYPFLFLFFGAVMASAWFEGMGAGFFAVVISILAVDYFFIPPLGSFAVNAAAGSYLAAFVVCALVASWVSSSKKQSEEALKDSRDQLELRVSDRTAALMKTEAELARLSRVLSMGELSASIAHEIKQPLTAVVTNGHACIEWLSASPPNLEKARHTTEKIIQDGTRAGAVLSRIRALFKKEPPAKDWLDINEVIHELIVLLRVEAQKLGVHLRTELAAGLPKMKGDRVQLQQVVLNLMMNGMDAMSGAASGSLKELVVYSWHPSADELGVRVEDCGVGLNPQTADRIFDPFFTTKPQGIGMGLSISRSIIESHEGRLWATARPSGGTIFQFTVPIQPQDTNG